MHLGLAPVLASLWAAGAVAQPGNDVSNVFQAFRDGRFALGFQYRYEHVDQDGFDSNANASVLRTRLTFDTARTRGFSLTLEADDLRTIGADGFNSTRNGKTDRPVVADSTATELNQLLISHVTASGFRMSLGRQRLTSSLRRFVGSINWRLNEQTFDGVAATRTFADGTEASYAFVSNVNRVFGPKSGNPPADLGGAIHLIDVKRTLDGGTRLWGYGHFLDFDTAAETSTATVGFRVDGARRLSDVLRIPFMVGIARQRDHARNPFDYSADYWLLESGLEWTNFSVLGGIEVLEGTGRAGEVFSTPLAGLHGLNGWADQFIATPPDGLEDRYIKLTREIGSGTLDVIYHDYSSSVGGLAYGTEFDVSLRWPIGERHSLLIKAADFRADGFSADVGKFWIMVSAGF